MTRILLLDSWTADARAELAKVCEIYTLCDSWPDVIDTIDGVITKLNYASLEVITHMPNLRFLASATTGLDHLPLDYSAAHNIEVLSLQGETSFLRDVHATAEHTVALMLSLLRHIPQAHNDVCEGRWDREAWQGSELHGKVVGIVGLGRVGSQVANIVRAFGADTLYCDNNPALHYGEGGAYPLEEVMAGADILTLHVPLNDSTLGMIGKRQFDMMKPTAVLINTSRGGVINEGELLDALMSGHLAGAALDVAHNEPLINLSLIEYARTNSNLIITPHLGGQTRESRLKTQLWMVNKIRDFISGGGYHVDVPQRS